MPKRIFQSIKNLVKDTFASAYHHDVAVHGAAIAFYTIFSAAPLIIIVLALINFFLGEQQTTRVFTDYLIQLAGRDIATTLIEISKNARRDTSGFFASLVATFVLIFGATTVITQLKNSLNTIWGITKPKISSIWQYLFNRVLSLLIIFILTFLFLTSLVLEAGIAFFADLITSNVSEAFVPLLQIGSALFSVLVTILFFTFIFNVLPDVNARWRDVFIGACVTSLLFLIGKYLIGFYLGSTSMQASYKAAGSFIIFLVWIYYNVQIILLGAEFTQIYIKRYGKNIRPSWNAELIGTD